jgi:hypothetical protein
MELENAVEVVRRYREPVTHIGLRKGGELYYIIGKHGRDFSGEGTGWTGKSASRTGGAFRGILMTSPLLSGGPFAAATTPDQPRPCLELQGIWVC